VADRVVMMIGTRKGVFVAEGSKSRGRFSLRGPFGPGIPVYATLIDTRGTPRLYASSCNPFFGMKVLRSTDMGKSFKETKSAPAFPKTTAARWSTSGRSSRAAARTSCCAESSRRRCSEAMIAATHGRWFPASAITSTRGNGSRAPAGSACTRSSATVSACTSAFRRVDIT
jgi:hypothetical protein